MGESGGVSWMLRLGRAEAVDIEEDGRTWWLGSC